MSLTIPTDCASGVLEDLMALMLAGEASPGTRRFLETHARANPDFASRLETASKLDLAGPPPPSKKDDSLQTLRLVRQHMFLRTLFTAMGIAFTFLPLTFAFGDKGVEFVFLGKHPGVVNAFWSIAVASWVAMWTMHWQIRKRGL
ncbi:MAG TPA: hypothetical protein PKJ41_01035 [Bryobacteraceae bacterium]|nr:hypothetical protein [Bryobacteraceae bacterium]HPT25243.1 hypothetical protein [Bryobacteraceae bacterium]